MLEQLLLTLREGHTYSSLELAHRLNTTPQMIEAMLEHLQRVGVFRSESPQEGSCSACPLSNTCNTCHERPLKIWQR